jgi:formamidopyrimidine-DNA glycosylase
MMSGRLHLVPADEPCDAHTRLVLGLDDGWQLRFHDVRKFGRVYLVNDPNLVTARLGPEPLDERFTLEEFSRLLERRRGRLKPLLLNQAFLAGLGNIYADEALFCARLHPLRKADSIESHEQVRLYQAIRTVLANAIARRGTTLDDGGYVDVDGRVGGYRDEIAVYGRDGEPCLCCGAGVERIAVGGRSTHFCPRCQEMGSDSG